MSRNTIILYDRLFSETDRNTHRSWIAIVTAVLFFSCLCFSTGAADGLENMKSTFKLVSFDEGMKHQLNRSLPLTLGLPVDYQMLVLDPPIQGVVWAMPNELSAMKITKSVPSVGGFFHGRLTENIGYDKNIQSFICGPECGEADIVAQLKKVGVKEITSEKFRANGIPLLFVEADTSAVKGSTTRKLYMAYIATLIDTNVILISYRPPASSEDQGRSVWGFFKKNLIKSN